MHISKLFSPEAMACDEESDFDECQDHVELKERLRKTLYFGKTPNMDHSSLPMTELAVEFLQNATSRQLGKVDMHWASSVSRKAAISPCSLMLGMIYIERLKHKNPDYLQQMSSEDLFLLSMMVASKYLYDEGTAEEVYNNEWAESADLDLEALNQLEQEFLSAMDWNLYVKEEHFWANLHLFEEMIAKEQSEMRGFMTYSDLAVLTNAEDLASALCSILAEVIKAVCLCSLAYTAGVVTLALSPAALTLARGALPELPVAPDKPSCDRPACNFSQTSTELQTDQISGEGRSDGSWQVAPLGVDGEARVRSPSFEASVTGFLTFTLLREAVSGAVRGWKGGSDPPLLSGRGDPHPHHHHPRLSSTTTVKHDDDLAADQPHGNQDDQARVITTTTTETATGTCCCYGNVKNCSRRTNTTALTNNDTGSYRLAPNASNHAPCRCPGTTQNRCRRWRDSSLRELPDHVTSPPPLAADFPSRPRDYLTSGLPGPDRLTLDHRVWRPLSVG